MNWKLSELLKKLKHIKGGRRKREKGKKATHLQEAWREDYPSAGEAWRRDIHLQGKLGGKNEDALLQGSLCSSREGI
jgi:hypothetical protein